MSYDVEWPSLGDVALNLTSIAMGPLSAEEAGAFSRLAFCVATMMVNTYSSAKLAPVLEDNDEQLARVARLGVRRWNSLKSRIMGAGFERRADGWHIVDGIVRFSRPSSRNPVPAAVKSAVLARDGLRCVYCGDIAGPFHFDHLFPVARGGADLASNIVMACQSCNLSKRDRTILEWVAYLRGTS